MSCRLYHGLARLETGYNSILETFSLTCSRLNPVPESYFSFTFEASEENVERWDLVLEGGEVLNPTSFTI
jgi:hypothetical protein